MCELSGESATCCSPVPSLKKVDVKIESQRERSQEIKQEVEWWPSPVLKHCCETGKPQWSGVVSDAWLWVSTIDDGLG